MSVSALEMRIQKRGHWRDARPDLGNELGRATSPALADTRAVVRFLNSQSVCGFLS